MANTRDIVKRKKSVTNICKITRTMEMIATSRFKKAFNRTVGLRPYSDTIARLVRLLTKKNIEIDLPLLRPDPNCKKVIVLALTSNRGLCGGYNGNVLRLAGNHIDKLTGDGHQTELRVSGRKGVGYFKYAGRPVSAEYSHFDDKMTYSEVEALANEFIELFSASEIAAVDVIYTRFESTSQFYPDVARLLPVGVMEDVNENVESDQLPQDYIYSPSPKEILQELIPTEVRTRLYQFFCDAVVSEQVSRMRSMKAASDNADKMISELTRQYNRARQSQITSELLDILGGAEAIK